MVFILIYFVKYFLNLYINNEGAMRNNKKIRQFLFKPLLAGLYGYAAFFTVLLLCKWMGCIIDSRQIFKVDNVDLLIAMVGFLLLFSIRFLENFSNKPRL